MLGNVQATLLGLQQASGGPIHQDSFTDTNGTAITVHTAETSLAAYAYAEGSAGATIQSNALEVDHNTYGHTTVAALTNEAYVKAETGIVLRVGSSSTRAFITLQLRQGISDINNLFWGYIDPIAAAPKIGLYKTVAGSFSLEESTSISSADAGNGQSGVLSLERTAGDNITITWVANGNTYSATHASSSSELTGVNYVGLRVSGAGTWAAAPFDDLLITKTN